MCLALKGTLLYNKTMKQMTQIKKGTLEYCVLAVIAGDERYGYEIVHILQKLGLATPEGTIYPLLARLQKEGMVRSRWIQSDQGNPRKYYSITETGMSSLREFKSNWLQFTTVVAKIIEEVH